MIGSCESNVTPIITSSFLAKPIITCHLNKLLKSWNNLSP